MFKVYTEDKQFVGEYNGFVQAKDAILDATPGEYFLEFPNGRVDKYIKRESGSISIMK